MSHLWTSSIEGVEFTEKAQLSKHTTLKLNVLGDLAIVESLCALKKLVMGLKDRKQSYRMLGWGANQVLSGESDSLYIKLKFDFDRSLLSSPMDKYDLPASAPLNALQSHAQKFGLIGWEAITGIPGSLGGAIVMNAGTALGEIGEFVESVQILTPEGEIRRHLVTTSSFVYRGNTFLGLDEIIISAVLLNKGTSPNISKKIKEYMDYRKNSQPLRAFTCGCVWKNKDDHHKAGIMIDKSGLSNLMVGGLEVSSVHANFFENNGEGTFDDFQELSELLNEQMELHAGIRFDLEAKVY